MEKVINYKDVNYIVSDDGKIYSMSNIGRGKYHKEITQRENSDGYMVITVGKNGKRTSARVHRIIALAFVENPDPEHLTEVDHIDRDRKNNHASNLKWISSFENKSQIPFEERSRSHKHEANGRAKINMKDAETIRELYKNGKTISEIAKDYPISETNVKSIIDYKTWK